MRLLAVIPCTAQKHLPPVASGRQFNDRPIADAASGWMHAVGGGAPRTAVRSLYKGAGWALARDIEAACAARGGAAGVISAGLGFAGFDDLSPGYDITFASGSPDLVPGDKTPAGASAWWAAIGGPLALLRAVTDGQFDGVVFALSEGYLDAVAPALPAVAAAVGADGVAVLCSRPSPYALGFAADLVVRVDPFRTKALGGMVGNAPLVALSHFLTAGPPLARPLRDLIEGHLTSLPRATELYPRRRALGPDHARQWLRQQLVSARAPTSASAALRAYRGAGFALEQSAFHRLFREASLPLTAGPEPRSAS